MNTLEHALAYAGRGLHVFPCKPGEKVPATIHGCKSASNDEQRIRHWLDRRNVNLAIACGPSGLVVLDVDTKNGDDGFASLLALEAEIGELPLTRTARTPSGGAHLYFRAPENAQIRNSARSIAPGLDVRADGGYVLAPPSQIDGQPYDWTIERASAELPAAWIARLTARQPSTRSEERSPAERVTSDARVRAYCESALENEAGRLARSPAGERNAALNASSFSLATLAHLRAFTRTEVYHALRRAGEDNGMIGDDGARSFDATFESGWRAGVDHPRELPDDEREKNKLHAEKCGGARDGEPVIEGPHPPVSPTKRTPATIASVLASWRGNPLVHEPTGFDALDAATGGGPVYGTRWYINGAPSAAKTLLIVQTMHRWTERGIVVGFVAADEESDDIITRLAQRVGFSRMACETREDGAIDKMDELLGMLPVRIYDASWTIEEAAQDLADAAAGKRGALFLDSLHTVQCDHERNATRELGDVQALTARTRAIRQVATAHKLATLTTSEMNRASYKNKNRSDNTLALASGKGSGSIEYAARVQLNLTSLEGEGDIVQLEIAKNKDGDGRTRLAESGGAIYLEIDRAVQSLAETDYTPPAEDDRTAERDASRERQGGRRVTLDAAIVAAVLARRPGVGAVQLRGECRAACAMGVERMNAALALLRKPGAAVLVPGKGRAVLHYLDGQHLPATVLAAVKSEDRDRVIVARPPAGEERNAAAE